VQSKITSSPPYSTAAESCSSPSSLPLLPSLINLGVWFHPGALAACIIDMIGSRLPEEVSSMLQDSFELSGIGVWCYSDARTDIIPDRYTLHFSALQMPCNWRFSLREFKGDGFLATERFGKGCGYSVLKTELSWRAYLPGKPVNSFCQIIISRI
jgi:hypothetical protein